MLVLLAAAIDIKKFIIPNWLNAFLLVVGALFAAVSSFAGPGFAWVPHLAMFMLFFAAGTLMFGFGLIGGGDVKLMAVVAFWSGTTHVAGFLFCTALAGGLLSLIYLVRALWAARSPSSAAAGVVKDIAAQAVLAHTGIITEGKGYWQRVRGNGILRAPVPYGVAIAAGGVYVFASIARHLE